MKKILLAVIVSFLFITLSFNFTFGLFVDDGTSVQIVSSCGLLNTSNATYTVNESNIYSNGTCFTIAANNITLNLNGSTIIGNGTLSGINMSNVSNITILNGTIINFYNGLNINLSSDLTLNDLTTNNNSLGLSVIRSSTITLSRFHSENNTFPGATFTSVNNSQIIDSTIINNSLYGISFTGGCNDLSIINTSLILNDQYGLYHQDTSRNVRIINSSFINNTYQALDFRDGINVNISGNVFFEQLGITYTSDLQFIDNIVTSSSYSHISANNNTNILDSNFTGGYLWMPNNRFLNMTNIVVSDNPSLSIYLKGGYDIRFKDMIFNNSNLSFHINASNLISFINNTFYNSTSDFLLINSTILEYSFINSSIEIENQYGKLQFLNTSITASGSNLSQIISLAQNIVFVNTSADSGFNTSANITLNQISYLVPKVVLDTNYGGYYADCPSSVCTNLSFFSNIFKFNTSHFTTFKAAESDRIIYNCTTLSIENITYILNSSISSNGTCFTVSSQNIKLNLNGSVVNGNGGGYGLTLTNNFSFVIENGTLNNFSSGISFNGGGNNTIRNLNVTNNVYGLIFSDTHGNTVENVHLPSSSKNDISYSASNKLFCNNQFVSVYATSDKPIYLFNETVSISDWNNNFSNIFLCNANYSSINNITLIGNGSNYIKLIHTHNTNISNVAVSKSYIGLFFYNSSNNLIRNINLINNTYGLYIHYGGFNNFSSINTSNSSNYGTYFVTSNNNYMDLYSSILDSDSIFLSISNYNFFNNIYVDYATVSGLKLTMSSRNNFSNIRITNTPIDSLYLFSSSSNIFSGGSINHSTYGIHLYSSSINNVFDSLTIFNSSKAIFVNTTNQNNFTSINITNTSQNAVYVMDSSYTLLRQIKINNSIFRAINITNSNLTSIINNTVFNSPFDYYIYNSDILQYGFINNTFEFLNSYGKIKYLSNITANGANLSKALSITNDSVFINSSLDSGLNSSANLFIYGLSINYPKVMISYNDDSTFADCPSNICGNIVHDTQNYTFNVSHFTSYKIADRGLVYGCANINLSNTYYRLQNNTNSSGICFNITAQNVTFDLNTKYVGGASTAFFINSTNVTIRNGIINETQTGIHVVDSVGFSAVSLTIKNTTYGIKIDSSSQNVIKSITAKNNTYAFYFNNSNTNRINSSDIISNYRGVFFHASNTNTVEFSNVYDNVLSIFNNNSGNITAYPNYWNASTPTNFSQIMYGAYEVRPWLRVSHPDTTAPSINVTPASGTWDASDIPVFTVQTDDPAAVRYRYKSSTDNSWTGGGACISILDTLDGSGVCTTLGFNNGVWIFEINVTNQYGRTTLLNRTMTIDYELVIDTYDSSSSTGGDSIITEPTIVVSKNWAEIFGDSRYDITRSDFYITNVTFYAQQTVTNPQMTIRQLPSKPSATGNVSGSVYKYFEITKTRLEPRYISNIKLYFRVPKSWMSSKRPSEVALYRYQSSWIKLPTDDLSYDGTNYYFVATTPGFSYFAIGYDGGVVISTTTTQKSASTTIASSSTSITNTQDSSVTTTTLTNQTIEAGSQEEIYKKELNVGKIIIFGIIIIIITILILFHKQIKNNVIPFFEPILGNMVASVIDKFGFLQTKQTYKIDNEEFGYSDLIEYIKKNLDKGFTPTEIREQLINEGVPKKLVRRATKEL